MKVERLEVNGVKEIELIAEDELEEKFLNFLHNTVLIARMGKIVVNFSCPSISADDAGKISMLTLKLDL